MNAVAEPSAHSEVIGVGLRNAEVIEKNASLDTLLCERRTAAPQKSDTYDSELRMQKLPGGAGMQNSGMSVSNFVSLCMEMV